MNVDWIGFSLASMAVVLAPGPGSLFVAKTAATARARAGLMAMLGIMAGDTCLAFFPVFIRSAEDGLIAPYAAMTAVFMAISAAYLSLLIRASSTLATAFRQNRTLQTVARKLSGTVFIGFGLKAAVRNCAQIT